MRRFSDLPHITIKPHPAYSEWDMFNINQDFSCAGPSSSAGINDEQVAVSPHSTPPPAVSELPQAVATPSEHGSSTTADSALTQSQIAQSGNTVVRPNVIAARDRLPSLIVPSQLSIPSPPNVTHTQPPPLIISTKPRQDRLAPTTGTVPTVADPVVCAGMISSSISLQPIRNRKRLIHLS